jgi:imidazolonepropionase-like amidohydrolase
MTPYQILRSGTRNAAAYFDATAEFGTIEVGRRADLVLLRGNPLKDLNQLRDPAGVMVKGHWLADTEIRNRLNALAVP